MREDFLHFIWQYQYFNKSGLQTTEGQEVNIIHPGFHNQDSGPDFTQSKIKIADIEWVGQVEIHIMSSAWKQHGHDTDANYGNVILHVVWEQDQPVQYADGKPIPTIVLKDRVANELLQKSDSLLKNPDSVPCQQSILSVPEINLMAMKERALMERLTLKSQELKILLQHNDYDWEETAYQWLAKNMGFKINVDPMLRVAQLVRLKWIKKHRNEPHLLEALLFGASGLIPQKPEDQYSTQLTRDYHFLSEKYQLQGKERAAQEWKFMRTRPANFPTIRLAQLAILLSQQPNIFGLFTQFESPKQLFKTLAVSQSEYWKTHYRFGVPVKQKIAGLGKGSIQNLMINTVAPLLTAYGNHINDDSWFEKAIDLLEGIAPEHNKITRTYTKLGIDNNTAFDSQALIGLHKMYCRPKKCLQCQIGTYLLRA